MGRVWLKCSPRQLLWATRGHGWDFRILTPADATGLDRLSLYEAVFSDRSTSPVIRESQHQLFRAELIDGEGSDCWVVGARFLDPDRGTCDESGRRIPHELLLVYKKTGAPAPEAAPADWHLQVFAHLAPIYRKLFALEASEQMGVSSESIAPFEIEFRDRSEPVDWTELGTLSCSRPPTPPFVAASGRARPKAGSPWTPLLAAFALLLIVAVFLRPWWPATDRRDSAWLEGRWVEQRQSRWDGSSEEDYRNYVHEFNRRGPRTFDFAGQELHVRRQGQVSHFRFRLIEEPRPAGQTSVPVLIVLHDRGHEHGRAYLERQGDDRMVLRWELGHSDDDVLWESGLPFGQTLVRGPPR